MTVIELDASGYFTLLALPSASEVLGAQRVEAVVVDLGDADLSRYEHIRLPLDLPCVVIGVASHRVPSDRSASSFDILLADPSLTAPATAGLAAAGIEHAVRLLTSAIERHPQAAAVCVQVLRGMESRSVAEGLMAESLAYSLLQSGPEFAAWREGRVRGEREAEVGPPVRVHREDATLSIELARPRVHNALNVALRDALFEALAVAAIDPSVERVTLRGMGPSFCSGGDLSEFGHLPNPVAAHLIRVTRSVARLMALLADRTRVEVHGACIGAGIEIAAFAGRVLARPDAYFALPELSLGLIPGAGGTVSVTRRIGRHRTAWLVLSGARLDARTAASWGLVDELL